MSQSITYITQRAAFAVGVLCVLWMPSFAHGQGLDIQVTTTGSGSINSTTSAESDSSNGGDASASAFSENIVDGENARVEATAEATANGTTKAESVTKETDGAEVLEVSVSTTAADIDNAADIEVAVQSATTSDGFFSVFTQWAQRMFGSHRENATTTEKTSAESSAQASTSIETNADASDAGFWATLWSRIQVIWQ